MAYVLQYVIGFFCLLNTWDLGNEDESIMEGMKHLDEESNLKDAIMFIIFYIIFIPFVTSLVTSMFKLQDDQEDNRISPMFWFLFSVCLAHAIAMIVILYMFVGPKLGSIILGLVVVVVYLFAQIQIFKHNEFKMPKPWVYTNAVLFSAIFLAVLIWSIMNPQFSSFAAFTVALLCAIIIGVIAAGVLFTRDEANFHKAPIFYSPWLMPIYKYKPNKNDVVIHRGPTMMLATCGVLFMAWGLLACVLIRPVWIGVVLIIAAECIMLQLALYLIFSSSARREEVADYIDE